MNTIDNVSMKDATFYINEKKRTVTCVIDHTHSRFVDFVEEMIPYSSPSWLFNYRDQKKLEMPNKFVGIATCGENDEFSEEIGKKIAFSRAKDNLNRSFFKRADYFIKYIDSYLDTAIDKINRYGECLEKSTNHRHEAIEKLIGQEETND